MWGGRTCKNKSDQGGVAHHYYVMGVTTPHEGGMPTHVGA